MSFAKSARVAAGRLAAVYWDWPPEAERSLAKAALDQEQLAQHHSGQDLLGIGKSLSLTARRQHIYQNQQKLGLHLARQLAAPNRRP